LYKAATNGRGFICDDTAGGGHDRISWRRLNGCDDKADRLPHLETGLRMSRIVWRYAFIAACLLILGGCQWLPTLSREPVVFNPFPQLSRVAVAPFFNLSAEPTVDGRQFALSYAAELQSIPGFEVVPVGVVEQKMQEYGLLVGGGAQGPAAARALAQLLNVDAVVIGAITDYTPYYPPRCGLEVEWYSANPGFHPIPPGYGLPWGTQEEEEIPDELIFEAERALAREQLKTQEPAYTPVELMPVTPTMPTESPAADGDAETEARTTRDGVRLLNGETPDEAAARNTDVAGDAPLALPPDWPDPRGFAPRGPQPQRPELRESNEPVLRHVNLYRGTDPVFTSALETYVFYRDDARFGGWQSYLQRSDDFNRFCCHLHISEMLTARGGAGQTRVVIRTPTGR
jgi:hypothetical protein